MTQTTTTSLAPFPGQSTLETPGLQTIRRNGVALAYTEAGSGTHIEDIQDARKASFR